MRVILASGMTMECLLRMSGTKEGREGHQSELAMRNNLGTPASPANNNSLEAPATAHAAHLACEPMSSLPALLGRPGLKRVGVGGCSRVTLIDPLSVSLFRYALEGRWLGPCVCIMLAGWLAIYTLSREVCLSCILLKNLQRNPGSS